MGIRTLASGVAVAALAGAAVPLALSGSASAARATITVTGAPTLKRCAPVPATVGKTVTIYGTNLAGATKLTIGSKSVAFPLPKDTAKVIKAIVPAGVPLAASVKVTTPKGSAITSCTFKRAKKVRK